MRKMLLVAAAALALGSATAFAQDGGDWYAPNTPALTQQEVSQNVAAALQRQQQAEQVASQPSTGGSYMLFTTSQSQKTGFNPSFGGGGNG